MTCHKKARDQTLIRLDVWNNEHARMKWYQWKWATELWRVLNVKPYALVWELLASAEMYESN